MNTDRRDFLKTTATGLAVAGAVTATSGAYSGRELTEKEKLSRIASCSYPARNLFKRRGGWGDDPKIKAFQEKYGRITMLDFPQWTKDTYPGVYHMDLFSGLFGDFDDEDQYVKGEEIRDGQTRVFYEWDPSRPSSKRWLDKLANIQAKTGTKCNHISNNAPKCLADPDEAKRKDGVRVAKLWMDAAAVLGTKTMRVNTRTSGSRIMPEAERDPDTGYIQNTKIDLLFEQCIKSIQELADYGSKVGVKIAIENHWGLCASPQNIKIIIEEVNSPFCEAAPDFCNWETKYHLFHGIDILAPYTHTHAHATGCPIGC